MQIERDKRFTNKQAGSGSEIEKEFKIIEDTFNDHDQGRKGWNRLEVVDGSNKRMGQATLVAGTVVVSNTTVTASTRIFLSRETAGGTLGHLSISARSAGTSFTILSSSNTDTSTINWLLIEPK